MEQVYLVSINLHAKTLLEKAISLHLLITPSQTNPLLFSSPILTKCDIKLLGAKSIKSRFRHYFTKSIPIAQIRIYSTMPQVTEF